MARNIERHFINGDEIKWCGIVFPSVLVLLMIISTLFYLELNLYKKQQELSVLTVKLYKGKVMSDLAYQKIIHQDPKVIRDKGVIQYSVGSVNYEIKGRDIKLLVYMDGYLIFGDIEKLPNKKSNSLK